MSVIDDHIVFDLISNSHVVVCVVYERAIVYDVIKHGVVFIGGQYSFMHSDRLTVYKGLYNPR